MQVFNRINSLRHLSTLLQPAIVRILLWRLWKYFCDDVGFSHNCENILWQCRPSQSVTLLYISSACTQQRWFGHQARAIEKYVNIINVTGVRILHFGGYVNMEEHIRSPCPARIYHKPRSNGKRWIWRQQLGNKWSGVAGHLQPLIVHRFQNKP